MDVVANCQRVIDDALAMIGTVRPEDMTKPTPCAEWDVRALLNHMIVVCLNWASTLRDTPRDPSWLTADLAGDKPAAAYSQAAAALMQAVQVPGALDRTLERPFPNLPGTVGAQIFAADQAVHTWDLAKALGRSHTLPEEIATPAVALMGQFPDADLRGPGKPFGAAVECPADASVQDRLLALVGRQP